jgi:uncharacterized membrane protein YeaQ/YmgE (transglycosylase-associated protein family)
MMYILLWLLFGAIVGWIASIIMKRNHRMGLLANILVGLAGSALGIWIMELAGFARVNTFTMTGLIISVGGAALLIAIFSKFSWR